MNFKAQDVRPASGRKGRESEKERIARIAVHFSKPENQTLIPVGKLFWALETEAQDVIEHGKAIPVDSFEIAGEAVPIREGFEISLKTLATWGCFVCGSIEGSGVWPSPDTSVLRFQGSEWFYNPTTRELQAISMTCLNKYCAVEHKAHFVEGATWIKAQRKAAQRKAQGGEKVA